MKWIFIPTHYQITINILQYLNEYKTLSAWSAARLWPKQKLGLSPYRSSRLDWSLSIIYCVCVSQPHLHSLVPRRIQDLPLQYSKSNFVNPLSLVDKYITPRLFHLSVDTVFLPTSSVSAPVVCTHISRRRWRCWRKRRRKGMLLYKWQWPLETSSYKDLSPLLFFIFLILAQRTPG